MKSKILIYVLFPIAILCLSGHLLIVDPEIGYRAFVAGNYALAAYLGILSIALLNERKENPYRQVYPILILCMFVFAMAWLAVEELAGYNRIDIRFVAFRLGMWCMFTLALSIFAYFRRKSIQRRIEGLYDGTVYRINFPPSTPLSWIWSILTFRDRIGIAYYLDGKIYVVDKTTKKAVVRDADPKQLYGKAKTLKVSPDAFKMAWHVKTDGYTWGPVRNCRWLNRKILGELRENP